MFVSEIIDEVIETLGRGSREKALSCIGDAIQALQDEGDWNANIGVADIRVAKDGVTVSLPPEIETPIAVAVDRRPVFMRDAFYEFHLNGEGVTDRAVPWAWDDRGPAPCFSDIVLPSPVVAVAQLKADAGVPVRVLGTGGDGRVLRSQAKDGSWSDGVTVAANLLSDFPGGVIALPGDRVFQRVFQTTPVVEMTSAKAHLLVTGAFMKLEFLEGFASPLVDASLYFVRVTGPGTVTLHRTRLDAKTNQAPVVVVSTERGSRFSLSDSRRAEARTKFYSAATVSLEDASQVVFTAKTMPGGLSVGTPYFISKLDAHNFDIFETKALAESKTSALNVSSAGDSVVARALSPITPFTSLVFSVNHSMGTGDSVTVRNIGGDLPDPLIAGTSYFVRYVNAKEITLHSSAADASAAVNPITFTTPGSGTNSVVKLIQATVTTGDTSNVTAAGHGLNQPSGSGASATATVNAIGSGGNLTGFTSIVGGSGYLFPPIVTFTGGGGTGAAATAVVANGALVSISITAAGSGYTSAPTVVLTPAAGSYVQFSSTGVLPEPLSQATVYRAESPMTTSTFTLKDATGNAAVSISSLGSGTLFLNVSRTFSVGYNAKWQKDTASSATGDAVHLFVQNGVLPSTAPAVDAVTPYYLRVVADGSVELYTSKAYAEDLASATGRVTVVAMGSGQLSATTDIPVAPVIRDSKLDLEFYGFLNNLAPAKFSTDGTLPAPLVAGVEYLVSLDSKNNFSVLDASGNPVVLTDVGSGSHELVVQREFSVGLAASLDIPGHEYATGDKVTFSAEVSLPSPLQAGTPYYLRPAGDGKVEVYSQHAQAGHTVSTAGRISFTDTGSGELLALQILPQPKIAEVKAIEKPATSGFVALYAWDGGNTEDLTLLADMHPRDLVPSYRRIRVTSRCGSVRMTYRRKTFRVTSERDFINLESRMAILMMVKSQDLLKKNFFDESERYRLRAIDYLNKRNRALDGPRTSQIQINPDVTTVPDDVLL